MNLSRWLGRCLAPALKERGLLSREKGTSGIARTFHKSEEEVVDKVEVSTEDKEVESYDGRGPDERTLGQRRSNLDRGRTN